MITQYYNHIKRLKTIFFIACMFIQAKDLRNKICASLKISCRINIVLL